MENRRVFQPSLLMNTVCLSRKSIHALTTLHVTRGQYIVWRTCHKHRHTMFMDAWKTLQFSGITFSMSHSIYIDEGLTHYREWLRLLPSNQRAWTRQSRLAKPRRWKTHIHFWIILSPTPWSTCHPFGKSLIRTRQKEHGRWETA